MITFTHVWNVLWTLGDWWIINLGILFLWRFSLPGSESLGSPVEMTFPDNIWTSGTVVTRLSAWDLVQTHHQLEPKDILSLAPGMQRHSWCSHLAQLYKPSRPADAWMSISLQSCCVKSGSLMPSQRWRLVPGTEQRTDSLQLSLPSKRLPKSPGLLSYRPLQPHLQVLALFLQTNNR